MPNQAQTEDSIALRIVLLQRQLTVTKLARLIKRPRPTVSAAIHGRKNFPRVRAEIERALHVR